MPSYLDLTFKNWLNHRLDPDGQYGDFIGGLERADIEMGLKHGWGISIQMLENALGRCGYMKGAPITRELVVKFGEELKNETSQTRHC